MLELAMAENNTSFNSIPDKVVSIILSSFSSRLNSRLASFMLKELYYSISGLQKNL